MNEQYRILIVDDEQYNSDMLKRVLTPHYQVETAESGKQGLELAKQNQPDLILLDIIMPEMDGFEVILELKESDLTRHIPVIFITALTHDQDEEKGLFLGAVDYIRKPFNRAIVQARVRTQLNIVKQIRSIEKHGLMDTLTNLPNRRNFIKRMNIEWARAIREKEPISLLMMDVDLFKAYNDTYGHPQGDALLQAIAEIFTTSLKRPTDMVARYGGEEFIVLLPNTDLQGALNLAENIRAEVEKARVPAINADNTPTSTTISIGVNSIIPNVSHLATEFVNNADKALYQAKESGRNKVCPFNGE